MTQGEELGALLAASVKLAIAEAVLKVRSDLEGRLAILEGHAAVPGPQGEPGIPGAAGPRGEEGRPGIGLLELEAAVAKAVDARADARVDARVDERVDGRLVECGVGPYRGVWRAGDTYRNGESATLSGSVWRCNVLTTDRPGTTDAWTLMVKKGRDGRDAERSRA